MASKLLFVDAPSGPAPQVYLSLLPAELETRVVFLQMGAPRASEERLATIRSRGYAVQVVADRASLSDIVRSAAQTWKADGILALSERVVHEASEVARSLGLPANSLDAQRALRDKAHQRLLLGQGGISIPAFHRIDSRADLEAAAMHVGFPAVLKPTVGSASLAVFPIGSLAELRARYGEAVEIYERDPRQNASPTFVLERRLENARWHPDPRIGDFVSVESLVTPREVRHLTVTDKLPLVEPFRERGEILPSTLPEELRKLFCEEASRAIAALGMSLGAVHTEIKMTPDGPRIIEVNGRIGGGIAELLRPAFGYNVVAELARLALGEETVTPVPAPTGYGACFVHQTPAYRCRITRLPTVEELRALPAVTQAELFLSVGAEPEWKHGTYSCSARIFAESSSWAELMQLSDIFASDALFGFEPLGDEEDWPRASAATAAR
jgi:biotin carboxylase